MAGAAAVLPFIAAGTNVAGTIVQGKNVGRQYKYNKKLADRANKQNRANQEWALAENRKLLEEQRIYDSAKSQMARFEEAGLNKHLIYGGVNSGSSPISVGSPAPYREEPTDTSFSIGNPVESYLGAAQAQAQTSLTGQRELESQARTELLAIQEDIAATNPMLNPKVATSVMEAMETTARAKRIENTLTWFVKSSGEDYTLGHQKIRNDVEAMNQRLGLNTVDLEIRNKILESKEYENAVKLIQKKWLEDGSLTPEHIRQGLMMLLSKMIGK